MFSTRLTKENLTNEELLLVLPFECGYTCTEDGRPDWDSIVAAVSLISIDAILNPHMRYTPQNN